MAAQGSSSLFEIALRLSSADDVVDSHGDVADMLFLLSHHTPSGDYFPEGRYDVERFNRSAAVMVVLMIQVTHTYTHTYTLPLGPNRI